MEKKNNSSKLLIGIVIVLVITIFALIGYIVYEKVVADKTITEKRDNNKNNSLNKDKEEQEENFELAQSEKDEISTKISQILFSGSLENYIPKDYDELIKIKFLHNILENSYVSDADKALIALELVSGVKINSDVEQKSEEEVKKIFKNYFGSEWKNVVSDGIGSCPYYTYDATKKLFTAKSACGGTTDTEVILIKDNYQYDGKIASVDLFIALVLPIIGTNNAYITKELNPHYDNLDMTKIISTVDLNTNIKLDESNKHKANKFTITFKKADDGSFYFSEIKK